MILGRYVDRDPGQLRFSYGPQGKPALDMAEENGTGLRFSLSHSHGQALYAVTCDREVGIDLERVRWDRAEEPIAPRCFSPREMAVLSALPAEQRKIAFYTGLLEKLKLADDEIAAIMGHEIAHALREHGRERASQAMAQGIALTIIGAIAGISQGGMDLTQLVLNVTLNLPNSREHETEADRIGVELAARAGYDPRAAVNVWEKMARAADGAPPEILSTHPAPTTRIADLKVYAARVMPLYEDAKARK